MAERNFGTVNMGDNVTLYEPVDRSANTMEEISETLKVIAQGGELKLPTPEASVDNNTGTPEVEVSIDKQNKISFEFKNLKGETGPKGADGATGPQGPAGADGITSFNGRTGAITPQKGDYTATMVGAAEKVHQHNDGYSVFYVAKICDDDSFSSNALGAPVLGEQCYMLSCSGAAVFGSGNIVFQGCSQNVFGQMSGALENDSIAIIDEIIGRIDETNKKKLWLDITINLSLFGGSVASNGFFSSSRIYLRNSNSFSDVFSPWSVFDLQVSHSSSTRNGSYTNSERTKYKFTAYIEDLSKLSIDVVGSNNNGDYSNCSLVGDITSNYDLALFSQNYTERNSFICGRNNFSTKSYDVLFGTGNVALHDYLFVTGPAANVSKESTDKFIIGKGQVAAKFDFRENVVSRANAFRVTDTGTFSSGANNTSGADYAEMFEWDDGNPNNEDRVGRFVTLNGDKIRFANRDDDYIIGITSGNPSVVGDVHDDQWNKMFLTDIFGRPIWEDVIIPGHTEEVLLDPSDPSKGSNIAIIEEKTIHRQKINPDYNKDEKYVARSDRPEWSPVGLLGKLVCIDDGTCQVNGWATVADGGVATSSTERTKYRVMKRLDETHIQILIL